MESKKFSKEDYDLHDKKAKDVAREFWESVGYPVDLKDKDSYVFDLKVLIRGLWFKVEVEHKTPWKEKAWPQPFKTVDVPHRKHKNESNFYMLFNNDYDALCLTEMRHIHSAKVSKKDTTITEGELFFNVGLEKFVFFEKNENGWTQKGNRNDRRTDRASKV